MSGGVGVLTEYKDEAGNMNVFCIYKICFLHFHRRLGDDCFLDYLHLNPQFLSRTSMYS